MDVGVGDGVSGRALRAREEGSELRVVRGKRSEVEEEPPTAPSSKRCISARDEKDTKGAGKNALSLTTATAAGSNFASQ